MTRKFQAALAAVLIGMAVVSTSGGQGKIVSKNEFIEYGSFNIKLLPDKKVRVVMLGDPRVIAKFENPRLDLNVSKFEGILFRDSKQSLVVQEATFSGDVIATVTSPSAKTTSANQTAKIQSSLVNYIGSNSTFTSPGKLTIVRSDPAAGEVLTMSGNSGWLRTFSQRPAASAKLGFEAAELNGAVQFRLIDSLDENGKPQSSSIVGRADRATYDSKASRIVLTGNVHLEGDHPLMIGDINASKVELILDAKGEVEEIDVIGAPATATIGKKPPAARQP